MIIERIKYHLNADWGVCTATGEDEKMLDLTQLRRLDGLDPKEERPITLVVREESFAEIYGDGHLKELMRVCKTALIHGWWIETYAE